MALLSLLKRIGGYRWSMGAILVANGLALFYAFGALRGGAGGEFLRAGTLPDRELAQPVETEFLGVKFSSRNPFVPVAALSRRRAVQHKASMAGVVLPPPKVSIAQKISTLHLVGVLEGDPGQAVLEDARTHQTVTLETGQSVGDVRVERILADRIVVSSDGEQTELAL